MARSPARIENNEHVKTLAYYKEVSGQTTLRIEKEINIANNETELRIYDYKDPEKVTLSTISIDHATKDVEITYETPYNNAELLLATPSPAPAPEPEPEPEPEPAPAPEPEPEP